MPRIVRHTASDSIKIDPATWPRDAAGNLKNIWVCACGISKTFPFCDGSHKRCKDESPSSDYVYDPATGERTPVTPPESNEARNSTG